MHSGVGMIRVCLCSGAPLKSPRGCVPSDAAKFAPADCWDGAPRQPDRVVLWQLAYIAQLADLMTEPDTILISTCWMVTTNLSSGLGHLSVGSVSGKARADETWRRLRASQHAAQSHEEQHLSSHS